MIILKNNNITIPRGISPSFVTNDKEISLQKKSVTITKNGISTISPDPSYDAISSVKVITDVHATPKLQNIVKTYVENGHYTISPGDTYDGIGNVSITIDVTERFINLQDKNISITENGDYNVSKDSSFDGMNNVAISVNVPERVINLQEKTAVPTTSEQRIIPDSSFDALSAVNISAVDSTIDSNIIPANIKKGVSILGVEGTNEPHVFPMGTVLAQDILSDEPAPKNLVYNAAERDIDGYSNVEIERIAQERITKTITANGTVTIKPSTDYDVIKDVNITVNVPSKDPKLQEKTIDASSLINETKDVITETITPDNDFDGLSKVTYTRLNLAKNRTTAIGTLPPKSGGYVFFKPENGFDGFLNFGFRINYQEPTVDASTSQQLIEPSTGYACFKNVTVNPVTSAIDSNIIPENIKKGVSILGVEGTYETTKNQEKTLAKSDLINNTNKSVTVELVPDSSFTGMSKISYPKINLNNNFTVEFRTPSDDKFSGLNLNVPVAGFDGVSKLSYKTRRQDKTVTPSTTKQTVNCDSGYVGIRSVTVNPVTSAIDSNIIPENIKKGVSILGVEGSLENTNNQEKEIRLADYEFTSQSLAPDASTFAIGPDQGYSGISKLIIRKSYSPDYKVASANRTSFITNNKYDHEYDKTSDSEYLIADLNTDYAGMTWYDRGARSFNSFKIHKISVLDNLEITPSTTTQTFSYLGGAYSDTPNYDAVQNVVVKPVDKIPLRYIECDGNTIFKLISTNDTLNLLNSYTCDIQCSFTEAVSITSKSTLLNFVNITGSSHESEVMVKFGRHSSGSNMLQTYVHGKDKNILINNNYSQYTLGDETCIDVQIHNSVDSSTASSKLVVSDISGATGSNINTTLPNELIAFGGYTSAGKLVCTSSSGYRIHRIILHRDQVAAQQDKTRTYYEFIPVLHDGKPCFFETSTKTYRYNLGTGTPKYELL